MVDLRDRIIFVVMAARASDRKPQPDGAKRRGAIEYRGNAKFLLIGSAFLIGQCLPIESSGDPAAAGGIQQQVSGELLGAETIERKVSVDGIDDPVAIEVGVGTRAIGLVTIRIGITGKVEPVPRPALAKMG